jgi:hypothetical protein
MRRRGRKAMELAVILTRGEAGYSVARIPALK